MKIIDLNTIKPLEKVELTFTDFDLVNIFSFKNNKTLSETISHKRYCKLSQIVGKNYYQFLDLGIGKFLLNLKEKNDKFYKEFLNISGDKTYCRFRVKEKKFIDQKGIYIFTLHSEIVYIGRCTDSFNKRINYGYGIIHPKNCYIDGQSTNCHINNLLNQNRGKTQLYIHKMHGKNDIVRIEKELIKRCCPVWNIQK